MSRRAIFAVLTTLTVVLLTASLAAAQERKEVARKADCVITVGERDAAGVDLIIADCQWPIAYAKIARVIKAAETHDTVLSSVVSSEKMADGRIHQIHQASGISDREITLDFTTETLPDGALRVSWTKSAKQEPVGEDNVQAPTDDGYWQARDNGDGTSNVVYALRYDPGGRVPTWIVRSFQKGGISDIVAEMRAACAK
jgi:hypothetical protein